MSHCKMKKGNTFFNCYTLYLGLQEKKNDIPAPQKLESILGAIGVNTPNTWTK